MTTELQKQLTKKKAYYEAIWEITQEEEERLQRGKPIIMLLRKKKILVACVEEIDQTIQSLRQDGEKESQETSSLIENLNDLLKKIIVKDEQNQALLKEQLCLLRAKLPSKHPVPQG